MELGRPRPREGKVLAQGTCWSGSHISPEMSPGLVSLQNLRSRAGTMPLCSRPGPALQKIRCSLEMKAGGMRVGDLGQGRDRHEFLHFAPPYEIDSFSGLQD